MKEKQIQEQAKYETAKKRLAKREAALKLQAEKEEKEKKELERQELIIKENEMKERIKQDLALKLLQLKEIDAAEKKHLETVKIIEEKNKIIEMKNKELEEKQKLFKRDPIELWDEHFPQMKEFLKHVYEPIMNCSSEKIRKCSASSFFKLCGRNVGKTSTGKRNVVLPIEVKELKLLFKNHNVDYLSDLGIRKALKFIESGEKRENEKKRRSKHMIQIYFKKTQKLSLYIDLSPACIIKCPFESNKPLNISHAPHHLIQTY